eukprot:494537-Rhodomonas_salina.1
MEAVLGKTEALVPKMEAVLPKMEANLSRGVLADRSLGQNTPCHGRLGQSRTLRRTAYVNTGHGVGKRKKNLEELGYVYPHAPDLCMASVLFQDRTSRRTVCVSTGHGVGQRMSVPVLT